MLANAGTNSRAGSSNLATAPQSGIATLRTGRYSEAESILRWALPFRARQTVIRRSPSPEQSCGELAPWGVMRRAPIRALTVSGSSGTASHGLRVEEPGRFYYARGRSTEAESAYERVLAVEQDVLGLMHPALTITLNRLADIAALRREYDKSERLLQRTLAILKRTPGFDEIESARVLHTLGNLRWLQGDYEQAAQMYGRALDVVEHSRGPEHIEVAIVLTSLARAHCGRKSYAEAEPLLRRALQIKEAALRPANPELTVILRTYSDVLRKLRRKTEAAHLQRRAKAILDGGRDVSVAAVGTR